MPSRYTLAPASGAPASLVTRPVIEAAPAPCARAVAAGAKNSGAAATVATINLIVLNGGAGADRMIGSRIYNNEFRVDNLGDTVVGGTGVDTVVTAVDFTLSAELDNVRINSSNALTIIGMRNWIMDTITIVRQERDANSRARRIAAFFSSPSMSTTGA